MPPKSMPKALKSRSKTHAGNLLVFSSLEHTRFLYEFHDFHIIMWNKLTIQTIFQTFSSMVGKLDFLFIYYYCHTFSSNCQPADSTFHVICVCRSAKLNWFVAIGRVPDLAVLKSNGQPFCRYGVSLL